jgi:hypothetical protein
MTYSVHLTKFRDLDGNNPLRGGGLLLIRLIRALAPELSLKESGEIVRGQFPQRVTVVDTLAKATEIVERLYVYGCITKVTDLSTSKVVMDSTDGLPRGAVAARQAEALTEWQLLST